MKEDYLWDKTGESPEIERLENLLQAFRYQETEPPALPSKVLPFEEKTPRRMFKLAFTFTVCAAFVIVILGIWLQFSPKKIEVAKDSAETFVPEIDKKIAIENTIEKQNDLIVEIVKTPKQFIKRNIGKNRKIIPRNIRQNNSIALSVKVGKPAVKLTKEEKYAYNQLMLALSITSSKLKLVADKIDGGTEQNVVRENER